MGSSYEFRSEPIKPKIVKESDFYGAAFYCTAIVAVLDENPPMLSTTLTPAPEATFAGKVTFT